MHQRCLPVFACVLVKERCIALPACPWPEKFWAVTSLTGPWLTRSAGTALWTRVLGNLRPTSLRRASGAPPRALAVSLGIGGHDWPRAAPPPLHTHPAPPHGQEAPGKKDKGPRAPTRRTSEERAGPSFHDASAVWRMAPFVCF